MSDVIIVGAGMLGASAAWRLAQAGCSVTVLEAARVGAGTSGISFAWLNANQKPPRPYHDLNVAGLRAHFALRQDFAATPWLHEGGCIEVANEPGAHEALAAKVAQLAGWGYAAEMITPAQLAELEPDLDLAALGDAAIAWFPDDGWIDPVLYAQWMIRAAQRLGARLRIGVRVADLVQEGGRVRGVVTAEGERIAADRVVNCTGRWANATIANAGLHIPLAPRVGFLVFTPPAPTTLARVLRTPLIDMRPDGAGRLVLHDNAVDPTLTLDTPISPAMTEARGMVAAAARLFPGIAGIEPEAVRITARPVPADGYSAIGPVPGVDGYYLAVTHSGVTMGPHLGALIAQEIMGTEAPGLATFRPARFFTGNLAPGQSGEALYLAG
jgi:glycine/D-amino acid oxidase-like deaminating enzyme